MYNPTFESIYSIVPSVPSLLLLLIPAILMAISIVREKELGSMINFYVTPTKKLEYLIGKQLPYIAMAMLNYFILVAMSVVVFGVPVKGSFLMLTLCALLYVTATTGMGLVTSTFTSSQVAAVFVTAIVTLVPTIQYSGLLQPVSTLEGQARFIGSIWPTSYYMHSSVGAFTKGLGPELMVKDIRFLGLLYPDSVGSEHDRLEEAGEIAMTSLLNIFWLGLKELRSLGSDVVMLLFVVYAFTGTIYVQSTGTSSEVNNASIAFVDEDRSALSTELLNAFYPPRFQLPELIEASEVEDAMDQNRFMFVVAIPPQFEEHLRAGRHPDLQVNIDATAMQQAGVGASYIRNIIADRIANFFKRTDEKAPESVKLVVRRLFNPNGETSWFKSVVAIINQITLLTVILTGAAVIREREHGTLEHLLVMPLTAFEIALAKVWANGLVILLASALSLFLVVQMALQVPFAGSVVAVVLWRRALSLLCDGAGDFPGDDFAIDGPVRAAGHHGCRCHAASFRRFDTRRESAGMAAILHVLVAVAAFRQLFAIDHLSWWWHRRGLVSVLDGSRDRSWLFRVQPVPLPQINRGDEVSFALSVRRYSRCYAIPKSQKKVVNA